jgi:hypothetical protein
MTRGESALDAGEGSLMRHIGLALALFSSVGPSNRAARRENMAEDLDRAYAQVGRFMYHFANLEDQIDEALAKLLELKSDTANWVHYNMAFSKRFNFVFNVTLDQIADPKERGRVKAILQKVGPCNSDRNLLAHSRFEPFKDGVKFMPVQKGGKSTATIPPWSNEDFETKYANMKRLVEQLKDVVAKAKPVKGHIMAMGSPRALLDSG